MRARVPRCSCTAASSRSRTARARVDDCASGGISSSASASRARRSSARPTAVGVAHRGLRQVASSSSRSSSCSARAGRRRAQARRRTSASARPARARARARCGAPRTRSTRRTTRPALRVRELLDAEKIAPPGRQLDVAPGRTAAATSTSPRARTRTRRARVDRLVRRRKCVGCSARSASVFQIT